MGKHCVLLVCLFAVAVMIGAVSTMASDPRATCNGDQKYNISCNCKSQAGADVALYRAGRPVARLSFTSGGIRYVCTGFLVGNQNRLLTNNHCISTAAEAASATVSFNFEDDERGLARTARNFSVTSVVATDAGLDYSLLQLSGNPQATYGSLPVDSRAIVNNETINIIQHPGGRRKLVSETGCTVTDPTINTDEFRHECDTEGGSSGSPVFDTDLEVVGLHHASSSGRVCPNFAVRIQSVVNDLIGKGFPLGPAVARPGCPPAASTGGCGCGSSGSNTCSITKQASESPPANGWYAFFETMDDITIPGTHTFNLMGDSITTTDTVNSGEESAELSVSTGAAISLEVRNAVPAELDGQGAVGIHDFEIISFQGTVDEFVPDPGNPGLLGSLSGANQFVLDTSRISLMTIEGDDGEVPMYGNVSLLMENDHFPGIPARVDVYFQGWYDHSNGQIALDNVGWHSDSHLGVIPTLSEWGMIILSLALLAMLTFYALRRRRVIPA